MTTMTRDPTTIPPVDTNGDNAIALERVTVRFATDSGTVTALEDVSVSLEEGAFVALLGPSGCGKSTLLRVVADLIGPSEGEARVLGSSPRNAREQRALGFVFQDSALLAWRTAIENVRLPLEVGKQPDRRGERSPEELLELVGLGGREHAYPHELSGGMRQRVSIARALVDQPRVLLMDEPFGALDEITRDQMNEELLRIWEQTGPSILFVTHSIPEAVFLAQKVLVLSAHPGRVAALVDIDLPYPRNLEIRDTPDFVGRTAQFRKLLEGEGAT